MALAGTVQRLEELLGSGPLYAVLGPSLLCVYVGVSVIRVCVCVSRGVICQAAVAEVEPLRLKGYDPRSAVCVRF